MRSFVKINQNLAIKSANLMKSEEKNKFLFRLINILGKIISGRLIKLFHDLGTKRIQYAANSIILKNY